MLVQKLSWIILMHFLCQHEVEAKAMRKVACEGKILHLHCDSGLIKVTRANYGRTDRTTCITGKTELQTSNTQCSQETSLHRMSTRCDRKKSCSVAAENRVFSEPCVKIYKYLEVYYACVKKDAATKKKNIK